MSQTPQKHIVVVLGMHRSGTSAITRGLQVLGVDLGSNLMPANPNVNAKGFWEDLDVNAINIDLMKSLGHDWHAITPILAEELVSPELGEFKRRAVAVLRKKLSGVTCFGLKDPRMARLLPFWRVVFDDLKVLVSYVVICRNPMSVARSLAKRDGFDLEKSYLLWQEHMSSCLTETHDCPRIVVDYDLFMESPAREMQRISDFLGFSFNSESLDFIEYQTSFLDSALRHTQYSANELEHENTASPTVIGFYRVLERLSRGVISFDSPEVINILAQLKSQFCDDKNMLRYFRGIEKKLDILMAEFKVDAKAESRAFLPQRELDALHLTLFLTEQAKTEAEQLALARMAELGELNERLTLTAQAKVVAEGLVQERQTQLTALQQRLSQTEVAKTVAEELALDRQTEILELRQEQNSLNELMASEASRANKLHDKIEVIYSSKFWRFGTALGLNTVKKDQVHE